MAKKKSTANMSRKELRAHEKEKEKMKRQLAHKQKIEKKIEVPLTKPVERSIVIVDAKKHVDKKKSVSEPVQKKAKQATAQAPKDAFIEAEDAEIERLERLLGVEKGKKSKKSVSKKLNKEFELFEGISGGFGDFLNDLDELTDMIEEDRDNDGQGDAGGGKDRKKKRKRIFVDNDEDDMVEQVYAPKSHIIDDDEQERSDIDESDHWSDMDSDEDDEDGSNGSEVLREESDVDDPIEFYSEGEEGSDNEEQDDEKDDDEDNSDDNEDSSAGDNHSQDGSQDDEHRGSDNNSDDDSGSENSDNSERDGDDEKEKTSQEPSFTYKPVQGEDIYGRKIDTPAADAEAPKKYIPPAMRKAMLSKIDETSESVRLVRKELNGLMNKLSDSSKDSIVRSIKTVFDKNSTSVCSLVLKDCIMAACANPTQLMTSLIPIYAGIVAALHFSIGIDIGAFIIESLSTTLHNSISVATSDRNSNNSSNSGKKDLISNKLPSNSLLLLVYLYNLRVLHHTLIVDIMNQLANITIGNNNSTINSNNNSSNNSNSNSSNSSAVVTLIDNASLELRIELLELLINHCGASIRSDDPVSLKNVINNLAKTMKNTSLAELGSSTADGSGVENSRLRFMFEALTDLKNNKSRRIQTVNADIVKGLRKWLGTIKTSLGTKVGDLCLRVSLKDLLDAEQRGRWWKAGASWTGKDTSNPDNLPTQLEPKKVTTVAVNEEEAMLLKLATKLRMNTTIRRNIFVVLMSSRDIMDAFERLTKLELKGKQDREIVLVLIECCAQEKQYNLFYYELSKMLCTQNRQFKTTFQFAIWDFLKTIAIDTDDDIRNKNNKVSNRRVVNIARLLAQMICSFQLPLAVIKTIEMSTLNNKLILFLSTFFMALFKENISDEDFCSVVDRVATTKDFAIVRDNILFFLRRYLEVLPSGLDPAEAKQISRRKKNTLKTMEAMTVLDISKGMMEDEDQE